MKNYTITVNGKSYDVTVEEAGGTLGGSPARSPSVSPAAAPVAPRAPSSPSPAAAGVKAPMPGTVIAFKVSQGQAVKRGDVLLILEAMKMENEIVAPADGTVKTLCVAAGSAVKAGDTLVEFA
ncbi:MAG: biotin/lipoyl-containing protein [Rectinemataceae bacterium]